ncbi:MAG: G8 domain-containing protein [Pseudomonadota bacterium]
MAEHTALMDLVPRDAATTTAIASGDWDDPAIWSNGVPSDGDSVLIPEGVEVDYSTVSDARLFTVRIDGALDFATDEDSQMIFDTMVVSPSGHLIMGTADNPVQENVDIDLIVADNGPIDTNWDPMLLSRGLISHGDVTVHGAEKISHLKVSNDPMEGDTSIRLDEAPEGWQVGDTIVIAGTRYDGYKYSKEANGKEFFPPEDEVRVITAIEGNRVFFDDPLEFDHDSPRDDLKTSVANYTRNVSIESESGAEIHERGHVMFMHSDEVDVRYMEFTELGRTDKSEESFDISDIDDVQFDSNVQGRYSLHLHRTGVDDLENPTILQGNAVYGSPGWGIVHHDSNAIIDSNATYDTFGAGYVAETGNETGIWSNNIAIFAQGVDWGTPKNTSITSDNFDTARGGEGFWFQGRMVASVDNVAASVNIGFSYFHRGDGMIDFDSEITSVSDALYNADTVTPDDVPIMIFQGNETFAAREGLHVVKANTAQGHDVWTRLEDFTAWSVKNGVELEYTSHYILEDFDLVAKEPTAFSEPDDGITFGNNLTEIIVLDSNIEGFSVGIDLNKSLTHRPDSDLHDYFIINTDINDVDTTFVNRDGRDTILESAPSGNYDVGLDLTFSKHEYGGVDITGTKTDGLGRADFPGGMDEFVIGRDELIEILDTTGYWATSDGREYTLVDIYFTDRLTGDIYYETTPVYLDEWPVGDTRANAGVWADNLFNGTMNVGAHGNINTPIPVDAPSIENMNPPISALEDASTHSVSSTAADTASETWIAGSVPEDPLAFFVADGLFANASEISDIDLFATGGETVLATDGAHYEVSESRTLAIFEASAKVGFDGTDGGMAILSFEEGSTMAYAADDGDLGMIEEFDSSAFADPTDVQSGIDLGLATLAIDLSDLAPEAGDQFTLMDADEIVGSFDDVIVDGLGARDARVVIDYETDTVSLGLTEGTGAISMETVGEATDVTAGEEALWNALTAGQGVIGENDAPETEEAPELDQVA